LAGWKQARCPVPVRDSSNCMEEIRRKAAMENTIRFGDQIAAQKAVFLQGISNPGIL